VAKPDFTPWLCSWPCSSKQAQGFPMRFWPKWCSTYRRDPMLHLFCGASDEGAERVDARSDTAATVVGEFDKVILGNDFASAFADPPYTEQYAEEWGFPFPKPSAVLKVMRDAVQEGAIVGVLHLQVMRPVAGLSVVAYHPVFCGTTKHLRVLNVFRRDAGR
jgi:hypothetical protein